MNNPTCSSIKESFVAYLSEQTSVHDTGGDCIITVPMNTIDNRWVDITVESSGTNFFLVHDSGKSSDELFLQGLSLSSKKEDLLKLIANRYGVEISAGRFMVGCNSDHLQHSIWAVAHCSGLAMAEMLKHKPNVEDEAVKTAVGGIIRSWGGERGARVQQSVSVKGETSNHMFDFVTANQNGSVAVNVLVPSSGAFSRAERYGFQGLDIRESYKAYKKMAILANPDVWSSEAKRIVSKNGE